MTNEERAFVLRALSEYSCVTARELSNYMKRKYGEEISPLSITAALKRFEKEGKVAKSDCGIGTHYWTT